MSFWIFVIIVTALWLTLYTPTITPVTGETKGRMGKVRIKKIKCPRCKKKIWANQRDLRRGNINCKELGVCGLDEVMQKLSMLMLPFKPLKETKEEEVLEKQEEISGDGETTPILFEATDPLVIHIVNAKERYTNE